MSTAPLIILSNLATHPLLYSQDNIRFLQVKKIGTYYMFSYSIRVIFFLRSYQAKSLWNIRYLCRVIVPCSSFLGATTNTSYSPLLNRRHGMKYNSVSYSELCIQNILIYIENCKYMNIFVHLYEVFYIVGLYF